MKHLSFHAAVRSNLRGKYQIALAVLPIGLGFGSFVPTWFFARALAYALGIPDNAPVIDQPNGFLWIVLFLAGMEMLLVGGFLLGFVVNALILRCALGWSWTTVRGTGVCPEWLVRWLEGPTAGSTGSKDFEPDDDPMYDPQLDDSAWPPLPSGGSGESPRRWDR